MSAGATPGRSFVVFYALGYVGAYVALITPVATTLALKIADLDPTGKAATLGWISAVGAFVALVVNPIAGALSDRTRSRLGRRRPWIIGGTVLGTVALAIVGFAPSIPIVVLGWVLAQLGFNLVLAALQTLLPDQVPLESRGRVSAVLGISQQVSPLVGVGIASGVMAAGAGFGLVFVVPALVGAVLLFVLVARLPDPPHSERVPFSLGAFRIRRGAGRDFGLVWFGRFFVILGFAFYTTYQVYFITDRIGVPTSRVLLTQLGALLIFTGILAVSAIVSGRLSDRWQRRKPFVYSAVVIVGVGLVLLSLTTTIAGFFVSAGIMGVGIGAFFAVDLALVTDVLPDQVNDAAKDLGIFNIANALPQSVAPAIAPLILAIGGAQANYTLLFIVAAVFALLGAALILPVRAVR